MVGGGIGRRGNPAHVIVLSRVMVLSRYISCINISVMYQSYHMISVTINHKSLTMLKISKSGWIIFIRIPDRKTEKEWKSESCMWEDNNEGGAGETLKLYDPGSGPPSTLLPIRPSSISAFYESPWKNILLCP